MTDQGSSFSGSIPRAPQRPQQSIGNRNNAQSRTQALPSCSTSSVAAAEKPWSATTATVSSAQPTPPQQLVSGRHPAARVISPTTTTTTSSSSTTAANAASRANADEFWDFVNQIDFTDVARFYEPQGELLQRDRLQRPPPGEAFSIPIPIHALETAGDVSQQLPGERQRQASILPSLTLSSGSITPAAVAPGVAVSPGPSAGSSTMKRKARSESESANPSTGLQFGSDSLREHAAKRGHVSRSPSSAVEDEFVSQARNQPLAAESPGARNDRAAGIAALAGTPGSANAPGLRRSQTQPSIAARPRVVPEVPNQSAVLPAGKVFPIQIGSELFRLSGASISSDAPSYFSHFFGDQLYNSSTKPGELKTLYIDRDPETFRDISLHLQGYYVKPRDGTHFIRLFADAQFYSLPRLTQQLFKSEIFIQIGNRDFQVPRDLFSSPGDSPNFFSLGFAHFFSTPKEVFPGLDRQTLLRPPSIQPPAVPNKCGDIFADLVKLLQGYPLNIRDEAHRADLLRDARYFHLKGLEQRLLPCNISYNLTRHKHEMVLRLEDIRQSGISLVPTPSPTSPGSTTSNSPSAPPPTSPPRSGFINYARPFIDETSHELIVEIGSESTRLDTSTMRAVFHGQTKARIASLLQVIANKMGLPATQSLGLMMMQTGRGVAAQPASPANSGLSEERIKVSVSSDAYISVDGTRVVCCDSGAEDGEKPLAPRLRTEDQRNFEDCGREWIVPRGHWRVRVQATEGYGGAEVVLQAVRLEAFTGESARNGQRGFLA